MMKWNPFARYPVVSLVLLLLGLVPFVAALKEVQVRSDADALLESNPSQKATLEKVTSVFKDQVIMVVDLKVGDVFSIDGIQAIGLVSDSLMRIDGVQDVKSLTHSYKPVRKGFSFEMVPLVDRGVTDQAELERLRRYCLENPLIKNVMVSPDAQHATLTVTFEKQFDSLEEKSQLRSELKAQLASFENQGFEFEAIALPLVEEEVYTTIVDDLRRFLPVVAVFLIVTLGLAFRSLGFVILFLVNQALGLGLIAGTLQTFGYPFTVFTLLLFPLWAGIHLTLLVHLGTACQRAALEVGEAGSVVGLGLRRIAKSCGFATLTTLAGLLSLALADIAQVREAGLIGAYGVACVFLMTFGPGVAMMVLYYRFQSPAGAGDQNQQSAREETGAKLSAAWLALLKRFQIGYVALAGLVLVAVVFYLPQIRTGVRPIEFLPIESASRAAGELFNESYGGFNMFQLQVDSGKANGVNQMPFLQYLEKVQTFAESQDGVSGAYSYAQVLAMMNQIWEREAPGSLALPSNPLLLGTFSLVLKAQKFPFFEALCDPEYRTANVVVRSPDRPSDEYLATLKEIVAYAETEAPEGVTLQIAQGLHTVLEADQQLVGSQLRSALTALGAILVLLLFLWRSIGLALLAVAVNVFPVGVVIVVGVLLDVPLNSVTVMIAAVAFGISIDDTVHFVTQWLESRRSGTGKTDPLALAIQIKARPMIYSSLVLGGIFALLISTSFPPVQHFGGLSALAFSVALGAVFVLLPLALARRNQNPS